MLKKVKMDEVIKPQTEINRIVIDEDSFHDFELLDGTVLRLRYAGGQWINPETGEALAREPNHNNVTPVF